jgi:hypothetical protein
MAKDNDCYRPDACYPLTTVGLSVTCIVLSSACLSPQITKRQKKVNRIRRRKYKRFTSIDFDKNMSGRKSLFVILLITPPSEDGLEQKGVGNVEVTKHLIEGYSC